MRSMVRKKNLLTPSWLPSSKVPTTFCLENWVLSRKFDRKDGPKTPHKPTLAILISMRWIVHLIKKSVVMFDTLKV